MELESSEEAINKTTNYTSTLLNVIGISAINRKQSFVRIYNKGNLS